MNLKRITLAQFEAIVAQVVTPALIAQGYAATYNATTGLLNKVGKQFTIRGSFKDQLPELDGEELKAGKIVEEYLADIVPVEDYDRSGSTALTPREPAYFPPFYSYPLPRKVLPVTKRYDEFEAVCLSPEGVRDFIDDIMKKLSDGEAVYRYGIKRQMIGDYVAKALSIAATSTAFNANTTYSVGTYLKNSSAYGVVINEIPASSGKTWAERIASGDIAVLDLVTIIAKPVDTTTGEAFLLQVKKDLEVATDISQGHSFGGNASGAVEDLALYVRQGVKPVLDVKVEAGAFHPENLALGATIKALPNFGSDTITVSGASIDISNVYAVLVDKRALRLHPTYRAIRTQENAEGDFITYFQHMNDTAFYSNYAFIKVYKAS